MTEPARRKRILKKAEEDLLRLLRNEKSEEIVLKAAENIRAAMMSFFKGQREIEIYKQNKKLSESQHLKNLDQREIEWQDFTAKEIVKIYQRQLNK